MKISEIEIKNVLTKSKLPESEFVLNPYVGCSHRCAYCYARFMRRFTRHNEPWGTFLDVKKNAGSILRRQLNSFKHMESTILLGSVTDAYQPIERQTNSTREILEILLSKQCNISILTKSSLVTRDIDLLRLFNNCSVGLSISFMDDDIRRCIEPGASPIEERIQALKELHAAGIRTYVFIGPIFPILTDIDNIVDSVSSCVEEVWGEALNLRCGCREDVVNALNKCLPNEIDEVFRMIKNDFFWIDTEKRIAAKCKQHDLKMVGFYRH